MNSHKVASAVLYSGVELWSEKRFGTRPCERSRSSIVENVFVFIGRKTGD